MSSNISEAISRINFARSVNNLSPYFGLTTSEDLSATIALRELLGLNNTSTNNNLRPPPQVTQLIDLLINTSEGALTTKQVVDSIGALINNQVVSATTTVNSTANQANSVQDNSVAGRFGNLVKIVWGNEINRILNLKNTTTINAVENSPSKENPGLSVIQINSPRIAPPQKNVNAISIFMNGIPTIELVKAVPYINIQFIFGRDPLNINNQIQTLSLVKFLEGAVNVGDNPLSPKRQMIEANTISGSMGDRQTQSGFLSAAGMELFTAPQTLVNADEYSQIGNNSLRAVPVIDKFRPLMTLKSLNIEIAPAYQVSSYKTAKLEITLHDRSRLSEIADFIRPDLYGTTELLIEYGWHHPDSVQSRNDYGILINGMRSKEKYGIRNVEFTFDDVGQVNLTLDLFMKGGYDCKTELISTTEENTANIIRQITQIMRSIAMYRQRLQRQIGSRMTEIRGYQILETAGDQQGQLRLDDDIMNNFRQFTTDTHNGSNANAAQLVELLISLYGARTTPPSNNNSAPQENMVRQLTRSIRASVEEKIRRLQRGQTDPWLLVSDPNNIPQGQTPTGQPTNGVAPYSSRGTTGGYSWRRVSNNVRLDPSTATNTALPADLYRSNLSSNASGMSLAKLLLSFVAIPLASSDPHKWDDVQLIFYPFNQYAGFANGMNIGSLVVDVRFFVEQYTRYRSETINRASNMTIQEFMTFITSTIIDDHANVAYGIWDLYEAAYNRQTGQTEVRARFNATDFQTRLENKLRNKTPNGDFKMPQIDIYLETLPAKSAGEGIPPDDRKSILRIHVFDRLSTAYDTQAALLASAREDIINTIGTLPPEAVGSTPEEVTISSENTSISNNIIDTALREGLVESIQNVLPNTNNTSRSYAVVGGQKAIKEFVMRTMPYAIYGAQGSTIRTAQLSSQHDAALSTINMLRNSRSSPLMANGEQPGGLPLKIYPCEISIDMYGCPLIDFAQQFFVDFQTGTTADNIYGVIGLSHRLEQGIFKTEMKLAPLDAYGKYESLIEKIGQATNYLHFLNQPRPESVQQPSNMPAHRTPARRTR